MLLVYVDNIVIIEIDSGLMSHLQDRLKESFHVQDLGSLQYFLGLEMLSNPVGTHLHQHKYIKELILLASLQDGQSVDIPLEVNV